MSDFDPPASKRCPDCGEEKPASEYGRNKSRQDGLAFYCKVCFRRRTNKAYRDRMERSGRVVRERVIAPKGHKWCPGCRSIKSLADWGRNRKSRDGYNSYCKACRNERSARDYLKRTHKLTADDVREIIDGQRGVCVICLRAPAVQVDHDHRTGEIRGVLCFNCNVALGQCKDDPWILRRAAKYLDGSLVQFNDAATAVIHVARGGVGGESKHSPLESMVAASVSRTRLN